MKRLPTTDGHKGRMVSVVFRIPVRHKRGVEALSRDTLVSQSVLLRRAIRDVLEKHKAHLEGVA
jgi:hypothetical protein